MSPLPKKLRGMTSSKNHDFCTPDWFLERVRRIDRIALDPCSNKGSRVKALIEWHGPTNGGVDGLREDWAAAVESVGGGIVFDNTPYGDALTPWQRKNVEEAAKGVRIVNLCPARTDTDWFQRRIFGRDKKGLYVPGHADAVILVRGRIAFRKPEDDESGDPALFPSAIPWWGEDVKPFLAAFGDLGYPVIPQKGGRHGR